MMKFILLALFVVTVALAEGLSVRKQIFFIQLKKIRIVIKFDFQPKKTGDVYFYEGKLNDEMDKQQRDIYSLGKNNDVIVKYVTNVDKNPSGDLGDLIMESFIETHSENQKPTNVDKNTSDNLEKLIIKSFNEIRSQNQKPTSN